MQKELRRTVSLRYHFRCGYCGVRTTDAGSRLTIDHFQPRIHGGTDDLDNLVYCCHACNEFKGDYWQTEPDLQLLHPLDDTTSEHLRELENGTLFALTERGANHIKVLQLNRPDLIDLRIERQDVAFIRARYHDLEARLERIEQMMSGSIHRLDQLRRDPDA